MPPPIWSSRQMQTLADLTRPRLRPQMSMDAYGQPMADPYRETLAPPPPPAPATPPAGPVPAGPMVDRSGTATLADIMDPTARVFAQGPNTRMDHTDPDLRRQDPPPPPSTPSAPPVTAPPAPTTGDRDRAIDDFWRTITPDEQPLDAYRRAYRHFLGREIDPDTLAAYQRQPQALGLLLAGLYDSEEGRAYRATGPKPPPTGATTTGPTTYPSTVPARGDVGVLTGYPATLGRSMKHVFGAIASRYANRRDQLDAIMADAEFKQWFPNARKIKDDTIDFGGQLSDFDSGVPVGLVDVIRGGDDAWQWIDQNFVTGPAGGPPPPGGGPSPTPNPNRPPAVPPHTPIPRPTTGRAQLQSLEPYRLLATPRATLADVMRGGR